MAIFKKQQILEKQIEDTLCKGYFTFIKEIYTCKGVSLNV